MNHTPAMFDFFCLAIAGTPIATSPDVKPISLFRRHADIGEKGHRGVVRGNKVSRFYKRRKWNGSSWDVCKEDKNATS